MANSAAHSGLRALPSVDELLRSDAGMSAIKCAGREFAAASARSVIAAMREEIGAGGHAEAIKDQLLGKAESAMWSLVRLDQTSGTRTVINATGVVIHTNLGRAPLSEPAREAIAAAAGYASVEYDTDTGTRGRRGRRAESMAAELTGAEDAVIVNNCAAAAFFVLSVFASGGEVVVSRGELVEIGGDFRVPDVLTASGARLREVGTTNRTRPADYERAVSDDTRMLLTVHPSNYRIVGFTSKPSLAELVEIADKHGIICYEDIGSGALIPGPHGEPVVSDSIKAGVHIVTFSGDKLLGGPQAGIIAGRRDLIKRLRRHPIYRILRSDKLTYAGLEATLDAYRRDAVSEIPVQRMLAASADELAERTASFVARYQAAAHREGVKMETAAGASAVGGGAAPGIELPTTLLLLSHEKMSAAKIEYLLRTRETPIIVRIVEDRAAIDLRTVNETEEPALLEAILSL